MFVTLDGTSPWLGHNDYSSTRLFSSEEEIFISHADSPLKKNCISEIDSRWYLLISHAHEDFSESNFIYF
jgi:hypothetical protein